METPIILLGLIFLFFICLLMGTFWYAFRSDWLHLRQLKKRLEYIKRGEPKVQAEVSLLRTGEARGLVSSLSKKIRLLERIEGLMVKADVHWPLGIFILITFLSSAIGMSLGYLKWQAKGGVPCFIIGLLLPYRFLVFKKKRRIKKFEKQLPDAMDLIARGLKAGHGFASGMQLAATEMPDPLGMEFFQTYKEYNHGLDLNLALINLCNRVELRDLKFFTTAVMIQRETGGSLAEILERSGALIRERFKLRGQIKALTGEGRLSGLVLILLPPLVALVLYTMNPDYIRTLVHHPMGQKMGGGALFLQLLGILWIRKIVNIKV